MPFGSPSHVNAIVPLLDGLSAKGHNVTLLTEYLPTSKMVHPVRVFHLKGLEDIYELNRPNSFEMMDASNVHSMIKEITLMTYDFCEGLVTHPVFQEFARGGPAHHYDVVVMDPLMSECGLSLLPRFGNPPLIYYCTTIIYEFLAESLDIPTPYAYVPTLMYTITDFSRFEERLLNAFSHLSYKLLRNWFMFPTQQAIVEKYLPGTPSLVELERNASLVLTNSHSQSLDLIRPTAPFMIEVGGIHCRPPKPLPEDINAFLNASGSNGFIYFSLGSNVRSNELPPDKMAAFVGAFGRLKQNVLWKFESDLTGLPPNVQVRKWVSQQDVLGHSKIRLFISHGGQLSMQESICHGVPVLGFPVFGDQLLNIDAGVSRGFARLLEYKGLSEDTVVEAVTEMLTNKSYKERTLHYSALTLDRPMDPLATAIYWVEYVVRHNGAGHLRFTAARKLNFFQYFLLDVIGSILLTLAIAAYCLVRLVKLLIRLIFPTVSIVDKRKKFN